VAVSAVVDYGEKPGPQQLEFLTENKSRLKRLVFSQTRVACPENSLLLWTINWLVRVTFWHPKQQNWLVRM